MIFDNIVFDRLSNTKLDQISQTLPKTIDYCFAFDKT